MKMEEKIICLLCGKETREDQAYELYNDTGDLIGHVHKICLRIKESGVKR